MYVIMDAEWYEGKDCVFLAQISCLRIDADYQIVDRCDKLAAPGAGISRGLINWKKICFACYQKSDFTCASPLSIALEEISQWLNPDDILIWWHSDAESVFRDSCRRFNLPVWKACSIHQYLRKLAPRDKRSGSPYQICRRMRENPVQPFPDSLPEAFCEVVKEVSAPALNITVSGLQ